MIDRQAPGPSPKLNCAVRIAKKQIFEAGPMPAAHGLVRWPLCDLAKWLHEEFGVSLRA